MCSFILGFCDWKSQRVQVSGVQLCELNAHCVDKSLFFPDFVMWPRANFTISFYKCIHWTRAPSLWLYGARFYSVSWQCKLVIIYSTVRIVCLFFKNQPLYTRVLELCLWISRGSRQTMPNTLNFRSNIMCIFLHFHLFTAPVLTNNLVIVSFCCVFERLFAWLFIPCLMALLLRLHTKPDRV